MNRVTLQGRLGRDPELQTSAAGRNYVRFSVATNEWVQGKSVTTWHNVVCFNKLAENLVKYCAKGRELTIDGKITYSKYEKDGETRYSTSIIANRIEYGRKPQSQRTVEPTAVDEVDAMADSVDVAF